MEGFKLRAGLVTAIRATVAKCERRAEVPPRFRIASKPEMSGA